MISGQPNRRCPPSWQWHRSAACMSATGKATSTNSTAWPKNSGPAFSSAAASITWRKMAAPRSPDHPCRGDLPAGRPRARLLEADHEPGRHDPRGRRAQARMACPALEAFHAELSTQLTFPHNTHLVFHETGRRPAASPLTSLNGNRGLETAVWPVHADVVRLAGGARGGGRHRPAAG